MPWRSRSLASIQSVACVPPTAGRLPLLELSAPESSFHGEVNTSRCWATLPVSDRRLAMHTCDVFFRACLRTDYQTGMEGGR